MGLFKTKPGGSFLGNLTRAIGINKTATPPLGPSPGIANPSIQGVPGGASAFTTPGVVGGADGRPVAAGAGVSATGKDFYILIGVSVLLFVAKAKKLF